MLSIYLREEMIIKKIKVNMEYNKQNFEYIVIDFIGYYTCNNIRFTVALIRLFINIYFNRPSFICK